MTLMPQQERTRTPRDTAPVSVVSTGLFELVGTSWIYRRRFRFGRTCSVGCAGVATEGGCVRDHAPGGIPMIRWLVIAGAWVLGSASLLLVFFVSAWWLLGTVIVAAIAMVGAWDLLQRRHSVLRNYPVIGHARFMLERIRPEIQQYFIERSTDGTPFDRDTRTTVYERAKGTKDVEPFGTERDVTATGYEFVTHSLRAHPASDDTPHVRIGGPQCTMGYDIALYNVSAMSFGAVGQRHRALNGGAARGGFAHDTGEGGISPYHLAQVGDLIWEIGSGYFGCRDADGHFDPGEFAAKAALPQVKCISIKLSQGAKPGLGGVLPAAKVSPEIARTRGVPVGQSVISPPSHSAFCTPLELIDFITTLRALSGGKPIGFKLCVGSRTEFLAICKAMIETGITPGLHHRRRI